MTTALAYKISELPKPRIARIVAPPIVFVTASTPAPIDLASCECEYSDGQFHADMAKAREQLAAMAAEASRDYAEGRVETFPK